MKTCGLSKKISAVFVLAVLLTSAAEAFSITSAPAAADINAASAKISWSTDEESDSTVNYGIAASAEKSQKDDKKVAQHSIILTGLKSNTQYRYAAKSCKAEADCITSSEQAFTTIEDKEVTPFTVKMPKFDPAKEQQTIYYPSDAIDITGDIEAGSKVSLKVNNLDIPYAETADTQGGSYSFLGVRLDKENNLIILSAEDPAGTKKEITFSIVVDKTRPSIVIPQEKEPPKSTKESQIVLEGSVDEEVSIKVTVEYQQAGIVPPKMSGLKAVKVESNKVSLQWSPMDIQDFKGYIIYRSDVGPMDVISNPTQVSYDDIKVNASQQYTYEVSAINKYGVEGQKSNSAVVNTLANGVKIPPPESIDAKKEIPSSKNVITSTSFPISVPLNFGDGKYRITIEAEDKAGNAIVPILREIVVDNTPPLIEILAPDDGTTFFENVANRIKVRGKTEPNAEVSLFVVTVLAQINPQFAQQQQQQGSFEIRGIPNQFHELIKPDIDAACSGTRVCKEGSQEKTKADAQGNFEMLVDLTPFLSIAGGATQVPGTSFNKGQATIQFQNSAVLFIVAKDQIGLVSKQRRNINIGTCSAGEFDWAITPLTQYQSPFALSPERIQEGSESIYFYLKYDYKGSANARVTGASLAAACGNTAGNVDERYERACALLGSMGSPARVNSQGTMSYHSIQLSPIQLPTETPEKWKDYFKAFGKEVTFPFIITVSYVKDGKTQYQTSCEQVSYSLDDQWINPQHVLPDWLLTDFVNYLDEGSDTLQKANSGLRAASRIAGAGCLGSSVARFFTSAYRRYVEVVEELKLNPLVRKSNPLSFVDLNLWQNPQDKAYCESLVKGIQAKGILSFRGTLRDVTDPDLKRCFKRVYDAWQAEEKAYQAFRFSCDRLLGRQAPAKWTETATTDQIMDKLKNNVGCPSDVNIKGTQVQAARCRDARFSEFTTRGNDPDLRCIRITEQGGQGGLYSIGKFPKHQGANIYELNLIEGKVQYKTKYAIKVNDNNYMLPLPGKCSDLCGDTVKTSDVELVPIKDGFEVKEKSGDKKQVKGACLKIADCRNLIQNAEKNQGGALNFLGERFEPKQYKVSIEGYAEQDCFYDPAKNNPQAVSPDPNTGMACCCVVGKTGDAGDKKYFAPKDTLGGSGKFLHESKSNSGKSPPAAKNDYDYSDIDFSYRYYSLGFKTDDSGDKRINYNPSKYIAGRDFSACFGQNNQFLKLLGRETESAVIDPATQHEAAFQCAALSQISNRLRFMSNMMESMSACLRQVKANGKVDTGACKELFSQQLCGLMWQVVKAFTSKKCAPYEYSAVDPDKGSGRLEKAGIFTEALEGAVSDVQKGFDSEYNNAELNQFLGLSQGSVARKICMGAFGYDWNFGLDTIVDLSYTTPFASFVQAVDPKRTYLAMDPATGQATYEYRTGYFINPGCEIDYNVYLSCVGQKEQNLYPNQIDCTRQGDLEGSNCDCLRQPEESLQLFRSGRRLQQNDAEDESYRLVLPPSTRRYDHIKFELRPDVRITPELRDKCFPPGYTNGNKEGIWYFPIRDVTGRDILDCGFDAAEGRFKCEPQIQFEPFGTAQILRVGMYIGGSPHSSPDVSVAELKDGLTLEIEPEISNVGKYKCLKVSITPTSKPTSDLVYLFSENPFRQKIDLTSYMDISAQSPIQFPEHISVELKEANNINDVYIDIDYKDVSKDAGEEGIVISGTSPDEISIPSITSGYTKISQLQGIKGISLTPQGIEVQKEGVNVLITRMNLQTEYGQKRNPTSARIMVGKKTADATQLRSQVKNVRLQVFNVKPDVKEPSGADDCDFNNIARFPGTVDGTPAERLLAINVYKETEEIPLPPPVEYVPGARLLDYEYDDSIPADVYEKIFINGKNDNEVRLSTIVLRIAEKYNINYFFVKSIIQRESSWNMRDRSGAVARSSAGAIGLMQITPPTARRIGCGSNWAVDEETNIDCGVRYIGILMDYQRDHNLKEGLDNIAGGYNSGEGNMEYESGSTQRVKWQDFSETTVFVNDVINKYYGPLMERAKVRP